MKTKYTVYVPETEYHGAIICCHCCTRAEAEEEAKLFRQRGGRYSETVIKREDAELCFGVDRDGCSIEFWKAI